MDWISLDWRAASTNNSLSSVGWFVAMLHVTSPNIPGALPFHSYNPLRFPLLSPPFSLIPFSSPLPSPSLFAFPFPLSFHHFFFTAAALPGFILRVYFSTIHQHTVSNANMPRRHRPSTLPVSNNPNAQTNRGSVPHSFIEPFFTLNEART